jgi:2,4-dienoyl-CoA reductase (NADPH2)
MARHERFRFSSLSALRDKASKLGAALPKPGDPAVLLRPLPLEGRTLPNRLVALPMEGADADAGGGPADLTFRRYRRYAAGGSGLVWFEAAAVVPEGRSNPRQLMLTPRTLDTFKRLVDETRRAARGPGGGPHDIVLVLQLTHAGRFSRPEGKPRPLIVHHSLPLDPLHGLAPDHPLVDDETLDRLQDNFVAAANLAAETGFDGVDVKACHGYLVSELLAAHTRDRSRYGGALENRSRFLLETVARIADLRNGFFVTSRLNVADFVPYPFGFGMSRQNPDTPDPSEPRTVVAGLVRLGTPLLLDSLGIPSHNPAYVRPFDKPVKGAPAPDEHPLEGVARHVRTTGELQRLFRDLPVVGPGYSWLRQYFPAIAAGAVEAGLATLIGWGRGALAYPDFANDLAERGALDPKRVCTTCSLCSLALRDQRPTGCFVRDPEYHADR